MDLYTYRIVINKYVFAHLCLCYDEHCTNCQIVTLLLFLVRLSGWDRFIAIRFIASVIIFSILICFLYHILLWCTIMSQYYIHAWVFACVRVHMCVCWLPMEIKTLGIINNSRDSLILSFSTTYIHSSNFSWNTRFILEPRDFVQTEFDVVTPTNIFWLSKWC